MQNRVPRIIYNKMNKISNMKDQNSQKLLHTITINLFCDIKYFFVPSLIEPFGNYSTNMKKW